MAEEAPLRSAVSDTFSSNIVVNSEATLRNRDRLVTATAHPNSKSSNAGSFSLQRTSNMGQEGSREALNRDLHRAVADLRQPPIRGKLPSRASLGSASIRAPSATEELARRRRIQAEKKKVPRPDQYTFQASPKRRTSQRRTADGRLSAPPLITRPSIDTEALIASQLGQDLAGNEVRSPSGRSNSEERRETLNSSGVESADSSHVRENEGEEQGHDATGGAEDSRDDQEHREVAEVPVSGAADPKAKPKKKRGRGRPRRVETLDQQHALRPAPDCPAEQDVCAKKTGKSLRRSPRKHQPSSPLQKTSHPNASTSAKRQNEASTSNNIYGSSKRRLLGTPPSGQVRTLGQSASVSPEARSSPVVIIASTGEQADDPVPDPEASLFVVEEPASSSLSESKTVPNDPGLAGTRDADYEDIDSGDGEEDEVMADEAEEGQGEIDADNERDQTQTTTQSRSRGSPTKANTSRRLQSSHAVRESSPEEPTEDTSRLYGEWSILRSVVRAADRRLDDSYVSNDIAVNNLAKRCKRKTKQLTDLRKSLETEAEDPSKDSVGGLEDVLAALEASVQKLCDRSRITNQSDLYERTAAICELLFPLTVKLLDAVVCLHETLDVDVRCERQLTLEHLGTVVNWLRTISDLGKSVRDNLPADPKHAIKNNLHLKIILPLREMADSLSKQHADMVAEQHRSTQRNREKRRRKAEEMNQEVIRRRKQHLKRLAHKWNSLHLVRQSVIPNFLLVSDRATRKHLAYPQEKDDLYASDDTYLIDRVFAPRVGPTAAQVQRLKDQGPWLKDHVHALVWGLQHFDGVAVLEDVMREYCGRGGPLERYNVIEIAIKAAVWKERLLRLRSERGVQAEDWIKRIPVWTEPHVLEEPDSRRAGGEED